MVNFSRRWNGDGCFSPTMEWRWYLKILTITIEQDQPLAAMVFQWFFQLGTNGSQWFFHTKNEIRDKMRISKFLANSKSFFIVSLKMSKTESWHEN